MAEPPGAFDIASTFVHLGLGPVARALPDFSWSEEYLTRYEAETAPDGVEGRLVSFSAHEADWSSWERHPAGDELVIVVSGRLVVIQELASGENRVELGPRQGLVNPSGAWHTADVLEPGGALYITPGAGTAHRPRT